MCVHKVSTREEDPAMTETAAQETARKIRDAEARITRHRHVLAAAEADGAYWPAENAKVAISRLEALIRRLSTTTR